MNGFFGPLVAAVDHMTREGFLRDDARALLRVSHDAGLLLDSLLSV